MGFLSSLLDGIAGLLGALGPGGIVTLFIGCFLIILVLKVATSALNLITALIRWWKHLPLWGKQTVGVGGIIFAYKVLWPTIPKSTALLAISVGLAMIWWAGAMHLARRYGIEMDWSGMKVWSHHLQTVRIQRGLTAAVENGTGKKNGRARRPVLTDTGLIATYEPPDQMSAQELADDINNGKVEPSIARQIGWTQVNGTFAEARGNLVEVYVSAIKADGDDPLAHVHRWPGMEAEQ